MKTCDICYDLKKSNYFYNLNGLIFYFSSLVYLNKFKSNIKQFIEIENIKIKNKYGLNINLEYYLSISYYKKLEKRGFRVFDEIQKQEITENIIFINNILTY